MILTFEISGRMHSIDTNLPRHISIPLNFNKEQPNTYNIDIAGSKACETADFIGDTRLGGSCNFEQYSLIPHCNGTHTECVGHITFERLSVHEILKDAFIHSVLITVEPVNSSNTDDTYDPSPAEKDMLITEASIKNALAACNTDFLQGLIIRTLPNDVSKLSRRYMDNPPPFVSNNAMTVISGLGIKHLLLDIPSVDRTFDEGKLSNHHIFWDMKQGSHEPENSEHSIKTITEMIYVPEDIKDGEYILNLQIAPFTSDASPSRPVLFEIKN